ncbi:hypothetical protein BC628DRAFT_1395785 [Trametes gibbosa]|nr:hypothetical protein BC628DRAFT_1395785 [Trametes gibbosa]
MRAVTFSPARNGIVSLSYVGTAKIWVFPKSELEEICVGYVGYKIGEAHTGERQT